MRTAILALAGILALAPAARADRARKRPAVALAAAAGGTALGVGVLALGSLANDERALVPGAVVLAVGPSLGHLHAGEHRHAIVTSALRGAGMAAFALGIVAANSDNAGAEAELLVWGGGGLLVATTAYDLVDAPFAARRANVVVTPTVMQGAPGVAIAGAF